jgi:hypothetical protein
MMKTRWLALFVALACPAVAGAKVLTVSHAHAYADRVVAPALAKEVEDYIVPRPIKTQHCWQVTPFIVGCRLRVVGVLLSGDGTVECAQVATISYRHGRSGALRWKDSDSFCWAT